ncbi:MAG: hypothetical protein K1X75_17675 [Leptospirales bacterium]|nr:hypothetical protein [Leptospirales bacterium]
MPKDQAPLLQLDAAPSEALPLEPYLIELPSSVQLLGFDQLFASYSNGNGRRLTEAMLHRGFSSRHFYFALPYASSDASGDTCLAALAQRLSHIDVQQRDGAQILSESHGGALARAGDDLHIRPHAFRLLPATRGLALLHISSQSPIKPHLRLSSCRQLVERDRGELYFGGLFLGAQWIMALYNLFLFFSVRDRSYLYYAAYAAFFVLLQMTIGGFLLEFGLQQHPGLELALPGPLTLLMLAALWKFSASFLPLHSTGSRLAALFQYGAAALVVLAPLAALLGPRNANALGAAMLLPGSMLALIAGALALRRGYRAGRFFVLAFATTLSYMTLFGITRVVTVSSSLFFTDFVLYSGMPAACTIEILLLSFALGDRYRQMELRRQHEKAEFQRQLQQERDSINRELHDVIGSDLSLMLREAAASPEQRSQRLHRQIARALRRLRDLVHLNAAEADLPQKLPSEMEQRLAELKEAAGIETRSQIAPVALELRQAFHLQRIFYEAIANVLRHAEASRVGVLLGADSRGRPYLQIADNGRGFAPDARAGAGLAHLRERAAQLGARLRIWSRRERGVLLHIRLPAMRPGEKFPIVDGPHKS